MLKGVQLPTQPNAHLEDRLGLHVTGSEIQHKSLKGQDATILLPKN